MRRAWLLAVPACLALLAPASSGAGPAGTVERPISPVPANRAESAVVVDPRDPRHVVVGVMRLGSQTAPEFYLHTGWSPRAQVYVSRDGGRTYAGTGTLPGPDGARGTTLDQTFAWDPRGGPLYASYLAYPADADPLTDTRGGVWVARSDDGGRTWRGRLVGPRTVDEDGFCSAADKPAIAIDARGWVYAAWQMMGPCNEWTTIDLVWSRSTDGGRTWSRPAPLAERDAGYAVALAALPDGTVAAAYSGLFVADTTYPECLGEWAPIHVARIGAGGGVTTATALDHVCTADGVARNGSAFRVHQMPTLAYEPRIRSLVLAATDLRAGDEGLAVATSRDGGRSWTRGRVAADPGYALSHPQLAAGAGAVAVSYLASAPGGTYLPTLRSSRDGGRTWSAPVALASVPSVGAQRPYSPLDAYTVGHYQGLAVGRDGLAHAAWPDLRPRDRVSDVETWVRAVPVD